MSSKEILHDVVIEEEKNNKNIDDKIYEAFKKAQNDSIETLAYHLALPILSGLVSIVIGLWIVIHRPVSTIGIHTYTFYILSSLFFGFRMVKFIIWIIYPGKEIIKHDN